MIGLHASRAFCFLLLGTVLCSSGMWVGAHAFTNSADGAGAEPDNLRRLLSGASYSLRSLSADPDFQACDADKNCSDCLEMDASTDCTQRDVVSMSDEFCDGVKGVICCVFKDDQRCMENDLFKATIASVLEDACEADLPCLGGNTLVPPLGDDHENLAPSEDKTEGEAKGDSGTITAMSEVELGTGVDTSGTTLPFGTSFLGLEFIVALSCLLLSAGGVM